MTVEIYSSHEFTTTPWAWEYITKEFVFNKLLLNKPELKWEWVIKNLKDLSTYINSQNKQDWSRWHRWKSIFEKLQILWNIISKEFWIKRIDPIEYIIQLYYWDWLSINDIFYRINWKWINYKDESGFRKLLKQTFNWKLKETHHQTEITKKKIWRTLDTKKENLRQQSKKLEENRREEFVKWFIVNSKKVENPSFDIKYFDSLKNKILKIKYLLKSIYWVEDDNLLKLKDYPIWTRTIAKYFEDLINPILEKAWTKMIITPIEISRLLELKKLT